MHFDSIPQKPPPIAVLIIDDSDTDGLTYLGYLQTELNHTYDITQAPTLHAGIQLWKSRQFDLALLNLQLPDGDGIDFLQCLYSTKINGLTNHKLPVIVLIRAGNERQAAKAMQLGAIDYLIKEELTESTFQKSILSAIEYQKLAQQLLKSQQQQHLLTEISLQIRQSLDLSQILQATVDGLRQLLGCDRAVIYQFHADWSGSIAVESVDQLELTIFQQEIFDPCLSTKWHEPYRQGRVSFVHDRNAPALIPCYAELLASIQVRACLVTPILQTEPLLHDDRLWGLLIAHECQGPRAWSSTEIDLVQQLATQASIAIQQATAYTQLQTELKERQRAEVELQQLNHELEARVAQRTAALQQSEARLQEAHQIARLGHWEIDIPTGKITWSPEIFTIFGLNPNQPEPTLPEILQLFTPADRDRITLAIEQATATGSFYELDLPFTQSDGSNGDIFVRGRPIYDDQGQVVRRVGILIDITDRRRTEAALARYTEEVEDLYHNAPCGYHSLDPQGRLIRVNETELQWLGYSREEMIGQPLINFFTEESRQAFFRNFPVFLARGWVKNLEYEIVCKDGSILPVLISATAVKDQEGTLLYNRATMIDIRDLKAAEKALQASETQFRHLAENVPGIIYRYVLHPDGTDAFTYMSPHIRDICGLEPEDVIQDSSRFWVMVHLDDVPLLQAERTLSLEKLQPFHVEHRFLTPQGEEKWMQLTSQPTRQANGDVVWDGVATEITDRKIAEARLQQTNEELARATRLKDEFLANMSHELRTPLNAILGLTEALQDLILGDLAPRQLKALDTIEKSGRHLLELINDILDLAKISSGKMELALSTVPVKSLCESSLTFIKQQAFKKQIRLTSNLPDAITTITVDELRIKQVLINLLTNAIKFTPEGGQVTLKVTIEPIVESITGPEAVFEPERSTNSPVILLQVIDTGIGISSTDLAKLFQPFTQIDSSLNRKHMGTGLGLAMVQQIAELHGGWVKVDSQPNQGSCFTVALPYHPPIASIITQNDASPSPASCLLPTQPRRPAPLILLAEDNEDNIDTFLDYLSSRNYRIIVAQNGEAAVHLAKLNPPDIILMDIQMPIMDGLAAIQTIRSDRQFDDIPIIALTALAMPGDQARCIEAGATYYLSKPVSLRQLADTIYRALNP